MVYHNETFIFIWRRLGGCHTFIPNADVAAFLTREVSRKFGHVHHPGPFENVLDPSNHLGNKHKIRHHIEIHHTWILLEDAREKGSGTVT